ncbi:MAG TPA: hypothetical protein VFS65_00005 [Candidatus Saccharimonadales bacterium]|nr:hypothetical protein [Candidatus Saccharimonadales bacterium]
MSPSHTAGFTIIETMLFLAISGLLVISLLAGTGASINTQRYRDSVTSLMAYIQNQYVEVANVTNSRDADWVCDGSAQTKEGASGLSRGQSDCFIVGRYISIQGTDIATHTINGTKIDKKTGSDVSMLADNYRFGTSPVDTQTSTLEWGAKIAWPVQGNGSKPAGTDRSIGILLIRSPDSGSIYTFTSDVVPESGALSAEEIKDIIKSDSQGSQTICVDSGAGLPAGSKLAVFLKENATNSSAVETRSFETIQALGGDSQC